MDFWEAFEKIAFDEENRLSIEIIATVVATLVVAASFQILRILKRLYRIVMDFFSARAVLREMRAHLRRIEKYGRWAEPVLSAERELQKRQKQSIPILMVANHK
ncbi:MAG: hypothetical protein AAF909_07940, partial [Pseudomonadota bacterium]